MDPEVVLLGHASVRIAEKIVIYIDPFQLPEGSKKADVILITHSHFDHCSPKDIKKIMKDDTIIVLTPDSQSSVNRDIEKGSRLLVEPNHKYKVKDVLIETIPAYNTNKRFHPRENDWVGYIVTAGDQRIYHSGDSDVTPEMQKVKADIVFLPVGGTYTMTAEEAAGVANIIKPKLAIPMHYGAVVGSSMDAMKFKSLCKCEVKIF